MQVKKCVLSRNSLHPLKTNHKKKTQTFPFPCNIPMPREAAKDIFCFLFLLFCFVLGFSGYTALQNLFASIQL